MVYGTIIILILNSNRVAVYIGKITTSKTGEIATNNFINGSSIKNIIAVKIFDSAGSRNTSRVKFVTDSSGNATVQFPNGFSRENATLVITIRNKANEYTQISPNAIWLKEISIKAATAEADGYIDFIKVFVK